MKTKLLGLFLSLSLASCVLPKEAQTAPNERPQNNKLLNFLSYKMDFTAQEVLHNTTNRFPRYTHEDGAWGVGNSSLWTSGFYPGIYWYLYVLNDREKSKEYAQLWTEGVKDMATATDNDTGFQIFNSYGLGYQFTQNQAYKDTLLTGAKTLVDQRYNSTVGAFRAWPQNISNPQTMPFEVNVDMIMNMELVLWAGKNGGPQAYIDYAVNHADTTWKDIVRKNGSTFHVASYNADGSLLLNRTHQGWRDDSTWSRGQAWAIYGYAMMYRYTGLKRMLDRSIRCFDYYVEATKQQSKSLIPYSDFDAPLDKLNPRDSSAAAIVASAAVELYQHTGDERYLDYAQPVMETLLSDAYLNHAKERQSLLWAASEKWGLGEVGAIFGDYYLVESLYRWNAWTKRPNFLQVSAPQN